MLNRPHSDGLNVLDVSATRRKFLIGASALVPATLLFSKAFAASVTEAQALVDKFANANVAWAGPTEGVAMAKGKKLVIVALTMASVSNQRMAAGIQEAAALGNWDVTVINGEGTPDKFAAGIDTAISVGANGIALMGTQFVPTALKRARDAGIPIVGSIDTEGNPQFKDGYYAHIVAERGIDIGAASAAQLVVDQGADVAVALFSATPGDPLGDLLTDGAKQVFKTSDNPVAAELTLEFSELGTGSIGQKAVAAVQANPEIKAFWVSWDAPAAEIISAFKNAGISLPVYSTYADPQNVDFLRNGVLQRADVAVPLEWGGWAVVDNFNRIFAGKPLAAGQTDGVPIKLINAKNVGTELPGTATAWEGGFDFRTKYKDLWHIGA
jgi:ribose transport system substrate-binding protein